MAAFTVYYSFWFRNKDRICFAAMICFSLEIIMSISRFDIKKITLFKLCMDYVLVKSNDWVEMLPCDLECLVGNADTLATCQ